MDTDGSTTPAIQSWSGLKNQLRKTWRKLTEDDLDPISRDCEQLLQVVRRRYRPQVLSRRVIPADSNGI